MAIIRKRSDIYNEQLAIASTMEQCLAAKISGDEVMEVEGQAPLPDDPAVLQEMHCRVMEEIERCCHPLPL